MVEGHAWGASLVGAYMAGGAGMAGRHVWWSGMCVQERRPLKRAVRTHPECILGIVLNTFSRLIR